MVAAHISLTECTTTEVYKENKFNIEHLKIDTKTSKNPNYLTELKSLKVKTDIKIIKSLKPISQIGTR